MSDERVQIGVLLPTRGVLFTDPPDVSPIFCMATKAEDAGYHSVWVGDSVTAKPRLEALTTLGALSAITSRIQLGTAVFLAACDTHSFWRMLWPLSTSYRPVA